jgi:subtilisin-like proprotein convertase family protein
VYVFYGGSDKTQDTNVATYTKDENPDLAIPDGTGTAASNLVIPVSENNTIFDVHVYVRISHTAKGELWVNLTSPKGTVVCLHRRTGGGTDNVYNWYEDFPPLTTTVAGAGYMYRFDGEYSAGTWTLTAEDRVAAETGYIDYWRLVISYKKCIPNIVITGSNIGDQFGYSISGGNITGDSCSEVIVGAPFNNSADGTVTSCGALYVFNGSSSMSSSISASVANYTNYGENAYDNFSWSVSYAGDVNNDGYKDIIVGAPYYDTNDNGKAYVLTCRKATLTVSNWTNQAPDSANTGTGDVLMLNMTLTASECIIRVTNIRVNLTGTGVDADVSACRLFHDANDNGSYDAGIDVFLGNQTFSGGSLNFTLSFDVAYGTPEKLLLLFNISSSATVGNTVGANLTNYSFISVGSPDNVSNYNFPIQSTNVSITSAGDKLTVIGTSIAPGFVNQGSVNRAMLNLTFNASNEENGQITVMSINISLTGTGSSSDVSGVTIYNDTNGNGTLDSGDTQLNTTQVFSNGYVVFGNLNFAVYYSAGNYTIFVVYNISATGTIDATVGANVTNETKITVTSPDSVNTFSTIWSYNSTIIEPPVINYTIRNETGVLQEGVWKLWGNWTADPADVKVNGTNWLRIRNTNVSNAAQQVVVDFSQGNFTNTTKNWNISIDNNMTFWYFFTNSSSDTNATWTGARYNTTVLASGSYTFTFNAVGEYIWIMYRIEEIWNQAFSSTGICPAGNYTASFTVQVPP